MAAPAWQRALHGSGGKTPKCQAQFARRNAKRELEGQVPRHKRLRCKGKTTTSTLPLQAVKNKRALCGSGGNTPKTHRQRQRRLEKRLLQLERDDFLTSMLCATELESPIHARRMEEQLREVQQQLREGLLPRRSNLKLNALTLPVQANDDLVPVPQPDDLVPVPQTANDDVVPVPQPAKYDLVPVPHTANDDVVPVPQPAKYDLVPVPHTVRQPAAMPTALRCRCCHTPFRQGAHQNNCRPNVKCSGCEQAIPRGRAWSICTGKNKHKFCRACVALKDLLKRKAGT